MICVSIGRGRHKHMIAEHQHLAELGAELVELRLDYINGEVNLRRLLAEPMSASRGAEPIADAYFGLYTLAMTTGRPRSAERHAALLSEAGFGPATWHPTRRPFLTAALSARKP